MSRAGQGASEFRLRGSGNALRRNRTCPTFDSFTSSNTGDTMKHFSVDEGRRFAEQWLPAWTGNDPERLAGFYAEDAFYLDPAIPNGVRGKPALLAYFRKLLGYNPNWIWSQIEAIPMADGFLNKWLAKIPVGGRSLEVVGVCLVQFDRAGKIRRNEVYFDRSGLQAEIEKLRKNK